MTRPYMEPKPFTQEQRQHLVNLFRPLNDAIRKIAAAYRAPMLALAKSITEPPSDLDRALRYIRVVADLERHTARTHLDQRMDAMYADLGLVRD